MTDTAKIVWLGRSPLKSGAMEPLNLITLVKTGAKGDRLCAVVDARTRKCITQREQPRMALIHAQYRTDNPLDGLRLQAPGMVPFDLYPDLAGTQEAVQVVAGTSPTWGVDQGDLAASRITAYLNVEARIVWLPQDNGRFVEESQFAPSPISFVDAFPLLVTGRASWVQVCHRVTYNIDELRFRPNIVLGGLPAWAEDDILEAETEGGRIKFHFEMFDPRCTIINVTPQTATGGLDLLKHLAGYRTMKEPVTGRPGIMYGVYVRAEFNGPFAYLSVGDTLHITKRRERRRA